MKNTLSDIYQGPRLDPAVAAERLRRVIQEELTEPQRSVLLAYYIQELPVREIAASRGVRRSTVYRTLQRAEAKLKRYLKY